MERRTQKRHKMNQSALLSIPGAPVSSATIMDISQSGCLIDSAVDITPGTEILASLNSIYLVCVTRHSRPSTHGTFRIGASVVRSWPKEESAGLKSEKSVA